MIRYENKYFEQKIAGKIDLLYFVVLIHEIFFCVSGIM